MNIFKEGTHDDKDSRSPFSGSNFPPFSIDSLKWEAGRTKEPSGPV